MRYYGLTRLGNKIHLGTHVEYRRDDGFYIVNSFCGNFMVSYEDGEMPPAHLADEFCKSCFRGEAWEALMYQLSIQAAAMTDAEKSYTKEDLKTKIHEPNSI